MEKVLQLFREIVDRLISTPNRICIIIFIAGLVLFDSRPVIAQNITTNSSCSPVIQKNRGAITVKCGSSDIDVEFLLQAVVQECKKFASGLTKWGADIKAWNGQVRIAYFPQFNNLIVDDVKDAKSTIYEYDRDTFPKIYNIFMEIPSLYSTSYRYRDEVARMESYISGPEIDYLLAVDTVCAWTGLSIKTVPWIARHDPSRIFRDSEGLDEFLLLNTSSDVKVSPSAIQGYWCNYDENIYIGAHSEDEDTFAFERGRILDYSDFNPVSIRNARLYRTGGTYKLVQSLTTGWILDGGFGSFNKLEFSIDRDWISVSSDIDINRKGIDPHNPSSDRYQRCNRFGRSDSP